jgi:predicted acyltransferase
VTAAASPVAQPVEQPYRSTVAPATPTSERLLSLDVFRGLTIAGMLLVNDPGSWSAIYAPLEHAQWHGWTPTDLIFPFFLFIVGITTHLSLGARRARGASESELVRQVLRRGAIIFLLGMVLSGFPFFDIPATREHGLLEGIRVLFASIRIPGVLQRIAVVYVVAALIGLRTTWRQQLGIIAGILIAYWLALTLIPVPGQAGPPTIDRPAETLAAWVDRLLLDGHLWKLSVTWDPEGPLSTVPAIATGMLGILAGRWIGSPRPLADRLVALFAVGSLGMVAGLIWHWAFPINKNLWTSSYVVFTAGVACVTLATCMWLVDVHRVRWWTRPFVIFGLNPIAAYVGATLMARTIYSLITVPYQGQTVPLQTAVYQSAFASWLAPKNASLLFAVCYVLLWLAVMALLYRRRIILKV